MKKPQYANEKNIELEKQLEVCKHVIQEISWMARRYADGRQTYAPDMFNDAIKKLDEIGLGHLHKSDPAYNDVRFASDKLQYFANPQTKENRE